MQKRCDMQETMKAKISQWHEEGILIVRNYLRCEHRLVELLSQIDECSGYLLFKCESLKQYAVSLWELPENAAKDLVTVAKKAVEIPAMIEALKEGRATVSKLRKVCPVIDRENSKEWINLVAECPSRVIEKAVAMAKPEAAIKEQLNYVAGDRLRLSTEVSEELAEKIKRAQDLVAQKTNSNATLWKTLELVVDDYLNRHDPIQKAERAQARREGTREIENKSLVRELETGRGGTRTSNSDVAARQKKVVTGRLLNQGKAVSVVWPNGRKRRTKRPAKIEHAVVLRDKGQCTFVDDSGIRCGNRRWLHVHHIKPIATGGSDQFENLTTLCSGHHRAQHF